MRRYVIALAVVVAALVTETASAQASAVGKYKTSVELSKAFLASIRTIPNTRFTLKSSDKDQGTIQAVRVLRSQEMGSLFILVTQEDDHVLIEATFTRNSGFFGGGSPADWARDYAEKLKALLPDINVEVVEPGKD
ncbi:MAG TPA: hypothetical protein VGD79_12365 [Thermoanaerobaculia bacterium]|jgi:hypothetical protein